jgi:EpsD family peptidyl-prolyl cis-trans isomerase
MFRATGMLCVSTLVLIACARNPDQQKTLTGQVAALVARQVVTTLEIDNEMRLAEVPLDRRKDPAVVRQFLDRLVLRKYLVQQAINAKMDEEPNVLLDAMRAREQVLANAYVARDIANRSFGQADIERYIAAHPAKFAQRQVLTVEQIRFALGPGTKGLLEANKEMKTMDEIDRKLTSNGVPHTRAESALSETEIPGDLAKAIENRKPNEVFYGHAGRTGIYFRIKDEELNPLAGEAAASLALQALKTDALKAQIDATTEAARRVTKFQGDYAQIMSTPSVAPAAPGPASSETAPSSAADTSTH